ncbi:hypothetical protein EDB92DRAFT_154676 [Lactarius akahatsu]|uniref:Uncharacterized protein n=1 Tax=Lactarius akahatsu TaxID=416441 RepID=A0AAD4LNZ6_9AGAM|nr:hypothetical protein EDB92DRAFT_154676 [Lactarius akahatsu]
MLIINRCSVISGWGLFVRARQGGNAAVVYVLCVLHLIPLSPGHELNTRFVGGRNEGLECSIEYETYDDGLGMVVGKYGEGQKSYEKTVRYTATNRFAHLVGRPTDRAARLFVSSLSPSKWAEKKKRKTITES